jgi:hypothetical protein
MGWVTAERVCSACLGTFSIDPLEDIVIVCARRSEFICSTRAQYDIVNDAANSKLGGRKHIDTNKLTTTTSANNTHHTKQHQSHQASLAASKLPLHFSPSFTLRPCAAPSIATRPADEVFFTETHTKQVRGKNPRGQRSAPASASGPGYGYGPGFGLPLGQEFLAECGVASIEFNGEGARTFDPSVAGRTRLGVAGFAGLPPELVCTVLVDVVADVVADGGGGGGGGGGVVVVTVVADGEGEGGGVVIVVIIIIVVVFVVDVDVDGGGGGGGG